MKIIDLIDETINEEQIRSYFAFIDSLSGNEISINIFMKLIYHLSDEKKEKIIKISKIDPQLMIAFKNNEQISSYLAFIDSLPQGKFISGFYFMKKIYHLSDKIKEQIIKISKIYPELITDFIKEKIKENINDYQLISYLDFIDHFPPGKFISINKFINLSYADKNKMLSKLKEA